MCIFQVAEESLSLADQRLDLYQMNQCTNQGARMRAEGTELWYIFCAISLFGALDEVEIGEQWYSVVYKQLCLAVVTKEI